MAEAHSGQAPEARPSLSLGLSLLPIIALFGAIGISMATVGTGGGALLLSILFAATIAGLVARKAGAGWQEIQQETGRQIADALPAILILLTIGALIGSWMFSGTIPMMVVLGIDHQTVQQIAHTIGYFNLERVQLTRKQMISDVVVGEERHSALAETITNHIGNLGLHNRQLTIA